MIWMMPFQREVDFLEQIEKMVNFKAFYGTLNIEKPWQVLVYRAALRIIYCLVTELINSLTMGKYNALCADNFLHCVSLSIFKPNRVTSWHNYARNNNNYLITNWFIIQLPKPKALPTDSYVYSYGNTRYYYTYISSLYLTAIG